MAKGDLYCIKTNLGYGLFHEFENNYKGFLQPFYLVYFTQIKDLSEEQIAKALRGEYYLQRLILVGDWVLNFNINDIKQNIGIEFGPEDFNIDVNNYYIGKCYFTYLGQYDLPNDVKLPRFTRDAEFSYFTGKHCWYIHDELMKDLVRKENGKPKKYNKLDKEIALYPRHIGVWPAKLLRHFNNNYRPEQDDEWVEKMLEEYYIENPNMRPTDIKYEEVRLPLPVDNLRNCLENPENEREYLQFCDRLEEALQTFINILDENRKSVQKPLIKLIKELNKLEKETGLIGSMEAEELYEYIIKILRSLKKARLIETLEAYREW